MANKLKTLKIISAFIIAVSILNVGCERDLSDDAEFATFPTDGAVFIDAFSSGLDYFPFVNDGADPEAFSVDTDEVFSGTSSMRFDVPNFGNGFVGAAFNTTGPRDLTGYNALTFYAKASQGATLDAIGFGINGANGSRHQVTLNGLQISTSWQKYVIPIPDPSKLFNETGLFWLAEGASFPGDEGGYTFWLDEVQFENLGTIAQPQPAIFNGEDIAQQGFLGSTVTVSGLTQTYNLDTGENRTVTAAYGYFDFESSAPEVASVDEFGVVTIRDDGMATITAEIAGVEADGSLTLTIDGAFDSSPTPPSRDAADVISIFSDAYTNVNALNFAAFNNQDIQINVQNFNNNSIATYENLQFVGLSWDGTVDVSGMDFLHIDAKMLSAGSSFIVELIDFGPDNVDNGFAGSDGTAGGFDATSQVVQDQWVSIDIPINGFTLETGGGGSGSPNLNNIGYVVLVSNSGAFIVDNIYFYRN